MALKRNTLTLKKYHDVLQNNIYELKGS